MPLPAELICYQMAVRFPIGMIPLNIVVSGMSQSMILNASDDNDGSGGTVRKSGRSVSARAAR